MRMRREYQMGYVQEESDSFSSHSGGSLKHFGSAGIKRKKEKVRTVCMYACLHAFACTGLHACLHAFACTALHACIHAFACRGLHVGVCMHAFACMHACLCMHVCMHLHAGVCMHGFACMRLHACVFGAAGHICVREGGGSI